MDRPRDDRRHTRRLLDALDRAEEIISVAYAVLLGAIVVIVLVVLAFLILNPPPGWGLQGEWFYLGVAVLLVMGWVGAQVANLLGRHRAREARRLDRWLLRAREAEAAQSSVSPRSGRSAASNAVDEQPGEAAGDTGEARTA